MKIFYFILFLFLIHFEKKIIAKTWIIDGKKYDDELLKKNDFLNPEHFPRGTFIYDKNGFLIAKGKFYQGTPPKSKGNFIYKEQKFENSGEFNNLIVNQFNESKIDEKEANLMFKVGLNFDNYFLAFHYNLGKILIFQKKYQEALFHFEFLTKQKPAIPKSYLYAGKIAERIQNSKKALLFYRKCLKQSNLYIFCFLALSEHYLKSKNIKLAIETLRKIPENVPSYPATYLGLAKIHLKTDQTNQAYQNLKDLQSYFKNYPKSFYFYLAESCFQTGKFKQAIVNYKKILNYPKNIFFINHFSYTIKKKIEKAKKLNNNLKQ